MNPRPDGPKPPALPTALYPVIRFSAFLRFRSSVVEHVVKGCAEKMCPRKSGVFARFFGRRSENERSASMLPNHPRYQLRYTRLFGFPAFCVFVRLWSNMWSKAALRKCVREKAACLRGFSDVDRRTSAARPCSQTTRATNCATPGCLCPSRPT